MVRVPRVLGRATSLEISGGVCYSPQDLDVTLPPIQQRCIAFEESNPIFEATTHVTSDPIYLTTARSPISQLQEIVFRRCTSPALPRRSRGSNVWQRENGASARIPQNTRIVVRSGLEKGNVFRWMDGRVEKKGKKMKRDVFIGKTNLDNELAIICSEWPYSVSRRRGIAGK